MTALHWAMLALMARQLFVRDNTQMDPFNLKTLAQYCLIGDPSIHPVSVQSATNVPTSVSITDSDRFFRAERRQKMKIAGDFLMKTKPTASKRATVDGLSQSTRNVLSDIVRNVGLHEEQTFVAFDVEDPPESKGLAPEATTAPLRYLIAIGTPEGDANESVKRGIAIVAKESGGRIMGYRIYHQR